MHNPCTLALKIDVDTERGTRIGVPNLLSLLENLQIPATFYLSLGPDNTGRAIQRVFRRGFLKKISRTNVISTYGIPTLLNGILLPGPHIGRKHEQLLRSIKDRGFDVGIHAYDHQKWQDNLEKMSKQDFTLEFKKAQDEFARIFGEPTVTAAAPGWQANEITLEVYDEAKLKYASDCRGVSPFYPRYKNIDHQVLQIPTTLPTLDELLGKPGFPLNSLVDYYKSLLKSDLPNILTLHPELEGMKYLNWFQSLLMAYKKHNVEFKKLSEIATQSNYPRYAMERGVVEGRSGTLAVQRTPRDDGGSVTDAASRKLALDSNHSFIVQAPAGSGKTTLLVERYLTLLALVNHPEEILAITFTRKAAWEMRSRIINALKQANTPLVQNALKQNQLRGWNLLENPNRLRIQTIDAWCSHLVHQAPLFSSVTTGYKIVQDDEADLYYKTAAVEMLQSFTEAEYAPSFEKLLLHLNNDWERASRLFVNMLRVRDQWLPHIVGLKNSKITLREKMEQELTAMVQENVTKVLETFPKTLYYELLDILKKLQQLHDPLPAVLQAILDIPLIIENTGSNVGEQNHSSVIARSEHSAKRVASDAATHALKSDIITNSLKNIAALCLTKEFTWRKKVDKKQGFITADKSDNKETQQQVKAVKIRMESLLQDLAQYENLRSALENLLLAPPTNYQDSSWEIIECLLELLPLLAAHLKIIFDREQITDYHEIAMAAVALLGDENNPTDLMLNLDYSLRHILIDEFQDTSLTHYRLIEKMISAWQGGDGHTIFLVGDPMQSIYRFRAAEVGLFLKLQSNGINNLEVLPIYLTANFRTGSPIVNWINSNFSKILPKTPDIALGQVPFKPSTATIENPDAKATVLLLQNGTAQDEAAEIVKIIKNIQNSHPEDSIALLVRAKSYLTPIIASMEENRLVYQALDLEPLQQHPIIRDLHSLTRGLFDLADNIAWLAILRASWCGLALDDLYQIAQVAKSNHGIFWDAISLIIEHAGESVSDLSVEGYRRLTSLASTLTSFVESCRRIPWRELIRNCWLAIGGPATASNLQELEYAESYFDLLDDDLTMDKLEARLSSLSTPPANPMAKITAMTIHRSKGLEFDHVIIPSIHRTIRDDEHKLLLWHEQPEEHETSNLIFAPIGNSAEIDPIYDYLRTAEQKRSFYETGRLLYVAVTRAKKSVYLTGTTNDDTIKFPWGSLLEQLAPVANIIETTKSCDNANTAPPYKGQ